MVITYCISHVSRRTFNIAYKPSMGHKDTIYGKVC
jgi:hypothetical protein